MYEALFALEVSKQDQYEHTGPLVYPQDRQEMERLRSMDLKGGSTCMCMGVGMVMYACVKTRV